MRETKEKLIGLDVLRPLDSKVNIFAILSHWPKAVPKLVFRLSGGWVCLALRAERVEDCCFSNEVFRSDAPVKGSNEPGFCSGLVHVAPYAFFEANTEACNAHPMTYDIKASLLVHEASGRAFLCANESFDAAPFLVLSDTPVKPVQWSVRLAAKNSDDDYTERLSAILRDIVGGRYYQLNLLRYYDCAISANAEGYARKFLDHGGAAAFWLDDGALRIFSLSPERFLTAQGMNVSTFPIKGTAAAAPDAGAKLKASSKDRAELNMIIDLMRNDLARVSESGSVRVVEHQGLLHAEGLVHLYGHIAARLRQGLRLGDLIAAVCPGGSITGAPKREVMAAISEYEGRSRGYVMGHVFYYDRERAVLDSNILIRTVVERDGICEYAAGSGIGIKSVASTELAEVDTKCLALLKNV